jgi:hypothetical protein
MARHFATGLLRRNERRIEIARMGLEETRGSGRSTKKLFTKQKATRKNSETMRESRLRDAKAQQIGKIVSAALRPTSVFVTTSDERRMFFSRTHDDSFQFPSNFILT